MNIQYIPKQIHLQENTKHALNINVMDNVLYVKADIAQYSKLISKLKIDENLRYFTQPHDEETLYRTEYNEVKYSIYRKLFAKQE